MKLYIRFILYTFSFFFFFSSFAHAGMPSSFMELTDVAAMRLQTISFAIFVFLVCAFILKIMWNQVLPELLQFPKITYKKSVALLFLWGMLFNLLLVMISGARELMTPGAWQPNGATYVLPDSKKYQDLTLRKERLQNLQQSLWQYAKAHKNKFPLSDYLSNIPEENWRFFDSGVRYNYYSGALELNSSKQVLVYEPAIAGHMRYVLFTNGDMEYLATNDIHNLLRR